MLLLFSIYLQSLSIRKDKLSERHTERREGERKRERRERKNIWYRSFIISVIMTSPMISGPRKI